MEKDDIGLIKCKQFEQNQEANGINHRVLHGPSEVGLKHDHGEESQPFERYEEEVGLHPLFVFFLVEEHPSGEGIGDGLHEEIGGQYGGEYPNDLVLLDDERVAHERADVEEVADGEEQACLEHKEELEAYLS